MPVACNHDLYVASDGWECWCGKCLREWVLIHGQWHDTDTLSAAGQQKGGDGQPQQTEETE